LPSEHESLSSLVCLPKVASVADPMEILFHLLLISSFHVIEDIACLMSPAALNGNMTIDQREGGQKPLASVGDNQLKRLAFETSTIEIM
jgi:hypothetical protein